jgi:hypothetical protein
VLKFPRKNKITIYTVETHCTSTLSNGEPWEHSNLTVYYLDNTAKRVYEEYGLFVKDCQYSWPRRTSSRSIADLERKYCADYEKWKQILGTLEIQVTKIGEL